MGRLILVLGGVRSCKSTFAEDKARKIGGDDVLYVATAQAEDDEMHLRVEKHRSSRPHSWPTLEAPQDVGSAIRQVAGEVQAILVDCLTFLVANRLLAVSGPEEDPFDHPRSDPFDETIEAKVLEEVEALASCAQEINGSMIVVSNEVGMGVVPAYDLGRAYRDLLGRANQQLADHADEVYFLVAGIPMRVK
ncbi:MAG TPA: bifunctional adenosylcobinamide kinase/adenosylcobinamide-phosphate guanylyltransferase [Chloroflexi bacterium]|nr:bifunctional adenosylcobinamide kinase/adenosylcobinamide-phosphate guanylyltransferase [Chloroflexota bacterium]